MITTDSFGYSSWPLPPSSLPPLPPSSPSWSSTFHSLLLQLSISSDPTPLLEEIGKLELDFARTAETFGRVILEELFTRTRVVEPVTTKGVAGGTKYCVGGIFFKFPKQVEYLFANCEDAGKLSGHELRACSALLQYVLDSKDVQVLPPLMSVVDYHGFRLLAVSHLQVDGESTLVWGSGDGGKTMKCNVPRGIEQGVQRIAKYLNLQPHISGVDDKTQVYFGSDCEIHVDATTNTGYLVDLARLLPPEAPPLSGSMKSAQERARCECNSCLRFEQKLVTNLNIQTSSGASDIQREDLSKRKSLENALLKEELKEYTEIDSDNPVLYKLLRPSLVQRNSTPLSSDAFSKFQSKLDSINADAQVHAASRDLRTRSVQRIAVYLAHREYDSILYPNHFSVSQFFHSRGVNVRFLNLVYDKLPQASAWRSVLAVEMVCRALKSMMRRRFRAVARLKGTRSETNSFLKTPVPRNSTESEPTFRASEDDFLEEARRYLSLLIMRFDDLLKSNSSFNHVSSARREEIESCHEEWYSFWSKLILEMKYKFGLKGNQIAELHVDLNCPFRALELVLISKSNKTLMERALQCLGFDISTFRFPANHWGTVTPDNQLAIESFVELRPVVKRLAICKIAEARALHKRALQEKTKKACISLRRARTCLEQVMRDHPPPESSMFLTNTFGEISYDLGIRVQNEMMDFELADEALRNLMKAEGAFRQLAALHGGAVVADAADENSLFVLADNFSPWQDILANQERAAELFPNNFSRNPLVVKTQLAKRYANVTSTILAQGIAPPSVALVLKRGARVMIVGGGDDVEGFDTKCWNASRKSFAWSSTAVAASVFTSPLSSIAAPDAHEKLRRIGRRFKYQRCTRCFHQQGLLILDDFGVTGCVMWTDSNVEHVVDFGKLCRGGSEVISAICSLDDVAGQNLNESNIVFGTSIGTIVLGRLLQRSRGSTSSSSTTSSLASHSAITITTELCRVDCEIQDEIVDVKYASNDDTILSASRNGFLRLFTLRQTHLVLLKTIESLSGVLCVDLTRADRVGACFDRPDGVITVWDGTNTINLKGHLASTLVICFARSEVHRDVLFSASADTTIRIWNVALLVCLRVLSGHADSVCSLDFNDETKILYSCGLDNQVRSWRFDALPFLPVFDDTAHVEVEDDGAVARVGDVPVSVQRKSWFCWR